MPKINEHQDKVDQLNLIQKDLMRISVFIKYRHGKTEYNS
jgi:hypothetical protein